jgi:transposase
MNGFDKDVLCLTVYEFYDKGNPTAFLMERRDIAVARMEFLRTMHDIRPSGDTRRIFYLDETWVDQNHSLKYIWQNSNRSGGLKVSVGKGSRIILCHAGSNKTGFVKDSILIFRSKGKQVNSDYHPEINTELLTIWFINHFINYLEEGSVIVIDNASYHSAVLNKAPSKNSRKSEIADWLKKKNITVDTTETGAELLQRVQLLKTRNIYELDQIANERGHQVIRLPPYHCQYNPIELMWAKVKRECNRPRLLLSLRSKVGRLRNEDSCGISGVGDRHRNGRSNGKGYDARRVRCCKSRYGQAGCLGLGLLTLKFM